VRSVQDLEGGTDADSASAPPWQVTILGADKTASTP
jgi:hypothetical protein